MRIISGKNKGFQISFPENISIRPTTDKAKEALFNIIIHRMDIENFVVLDLFAGSGSVGLEFLSRGAGKVFFVEQDGQCIAFIKKILGRLKYSKQSEVLHADAVDFIEDMEEKFDLVFADPPYAFPNIHELIEKILEKNILKKDGWLCVEHSINLNFSKLKNFVEHRDYGQTRFGFFKQS